MMVSPKWDRFILDLPILWRHIYIRNEDDENARVQAFLILSKECPLEVDITTLISSPDVLHLIAPHLSRVKAISIRPSMPHSITMLHGDEWRSEASIIMAYFYNQLTPQDVADTSCVGEFFRDMHPWQYHVSVMRLTIPHLQSVSSCDSTQTHPQRVNQRKLLEYFLIWRDYFYKYIPLLVYCLFYR